MRELSLFTGAGGGVLGSKILGWKTVGYVEYEEYCQKVIKQRIEDGILDAAPIFGDIRKFISEGYADAYQGMVDILTGGFPCQPFSVAGLRLAECDPRNMWPQTLEVFRRIKPRFGFFENVPGLMSKPYFRTILREISESGYDCRWCVLGASDVGANHRRKRLWILAYAKSRKSGQSPEWEGRENFSRGSEKIIMANFERFGLYPEKNQQIVEGKRCGKFCAEQPGSNRSNWWSVEPRVGRVVTRFPSRVDRLKALGNAQVPLQMAYAYEILSQGLVEMKSDHPEER